MAGKSKSLYLSIVDRKTHKTIVNKMFFNAKDMNTYLKDPVIIEQYPMKDFYLVKETY